MPWKPLVAGLVLLAAPLAGCVSTGDPGAPDSEPLEIQTLVLGGDSPVTAPGSFVAHTRTAWEQNLTRLWNQNVGHDVDPPAPPQVDFSKRMAIAYFAGEQPHTCTGVEIANVTYHAPEPGQGPGSGAIVVDVRELVFEDVDGDCRTTSPVHIVTTPKRPGTAVFQTTETTTPEMPEAWAAALSHSSDGTEESNGRPSIEGPEVPFGTIERGSDSDIADQRSVVVRSQDAWEDLWANHTGDRRPLPTVDFDQRMVVAVFAGEKPNRCHAVGITEINEDRGGSDLVVETVQHEDTDGACAQQVTRPFHIVALDRHDGEVTFSMDPNARGSTSEEQAGTGTSNQHEEPHPRTRDGIPFETLDKGSDSGIRNETEIVVRSRDAWRDLWSRHASDQRTRPIVDFDQRMVVAVFAGEEPNACRGIEIAHIQEMDDRSSILVQGGEQETTHSACGQGVTHPFELVVLDRYDGEVVFDLDRS